MPIRANKRPPIFVGVLVGLLIAALGWLFIKNGIISIRIAFAEEQTRIFEETRVSALQSSPNGAAEKLQYVVFYYPSDTKQPVGSPLDLVVERARATAIRDIMAYLRTKTGEDFGNDPQKWIDKYAK